MIKTQPQKWPHVFVDSPTSQFSILKKKYVNKEQGRIPLPNSVQQLWAQHQYSVMARDEAEYKYRRLGHRKSGKGIHEIYPNWFRCFAARPSKPIQKRS